MGWVRQPPADRVASALPSLAVTADAGSAAARRTMPRFGSEQWHPILLRWGDRRSVGDPGRRRATLWRRLSVVDLVAVFLALQFLIPARLVIRGMGAVGRPSVAAGIMLAFLWVISALRPGRLPAGRQPVRWALGIFLAVQLVGYAVGFDRLPTAAQTRSADRWLIFLVAFAGVMLAVADGVRTRRELDRILRWMIWFATAMSVVGALQFFGVIDLTRHIRLPGLRLNTDLIGLSVRGEGNFPRVMGTANHYIEFGVVLALVLPIALHYALFARPGILRALRWIAVGTIALGIPLSISRSAVVAIFVVLIWLAAVWPWRQRYNAVVIGSIAVAVFHVLNQGVLGTIKALFTGAEDDPSITARIERTEIVMDLWRERPILGWGAGMVTPEEFLLLDNQIYMFLLSGGVVAVAAFFILFFIPYLLARQVRLRGRDEESRHLGQTLAAIMPAAVVVSATFDSFSFVTFVGAMAVVIGAIGALWRLDGANRRRPLQPAGPEDRFVQTPIMADLRRRIVRAREETRPTPAQPSSADISVAVKTRPAPTSGGDRSGPATGPGR